MRPVRQTLHPLFISTADLGVGGLLYQQGSPLLGLLLLVCGLSVLITVAYEPLTLAGSTLRRHFSRLVTR